MSSFGDSMEKTVKVPEGVEVKVEDSVLVVKGKNGELKKRINTPDVKFKNEEGKIKIISKDDRKKSMSVVGSWVAHLNNMIKGVSGCWESRMKIVYSHFPLKLSVEGDTVVIGNFLGERGNRKAKTIPGTTVKLDKDEVIITGINKESVGQTAANIELATKIGGRDRRVFQDGCFITQQPKIIEKK